jgi:predicted Fe-Mo cluster-binding NifX family protein
MRVAIPLSDRWVAPILDNATAILVVDLDGGGRAGYFETPLRSWTLRERAEELAAYGVEVVLCDRVSHALANMILARGMEMVQHVSGNVDEVLEAHRGPHQRDPRFLHEDSAVVANSH